ncbi:TPA: Dot/Icm T4SS effector RavO [Legionella pneumophila]
MPTGIVLSSQSPETTSIFPRRGGTAAGINHVTGFPIIKMHRDAQARPDERKYFNQIKDGSLVFITGHSNTTLDHLTGDYVPPLATPIQPMSTDWTYKQFRDLILKNGNLKAGDMITIVLWACNAGEGGLSSGAALLGRLFREKQINTRIIASAATTMRFDGHYSPTPEGTPAMEFVTENGSKDIRIFDFTEEATIESKNKGRLYVTNNGIEGYNLYSRKQLESLESEKIYKVMEEIFVDRHYKENIRTAEEVNQYFSKSSTDFILRWSSANESDTENKYVFIAASFQASDGIHSIRYGINKNGELFSINTTNNKVTPIDILPQGIIATLTQHITENEELVEKSLHGQSTQENSDLLMFVTPLQVQESLKSHRETIKKKHEKKPRLSHGETTAVQKTRQHVSEPSGEKEEPKMDLSKRQRIPVVRGARPQERRHEFFSDSPKKTAEHNKIEKDKTTSPSRNPTKGG